MRNKLKILSLGLLLGGVFSLAACDSVEFALPKDEQSQQILVIDEKESIPHNEIQYLFEKVVPGDSSTASKVLDSLLLRLAKSYYGEFYDVGNSEGLRSIVKSDEKIKGFVASHDKFSILKADGTHDVDAEVQNVKDFYDHIITSLQKSFWSYTNNSNYLEHNIFCEKKFYDTQVAALYRLDEAYGVELEIEDHRTEQDGTLDYKSVEEFFGSAEKSYLDIYQDYIERSLLPTLYRKIIVEDYVIKSNYSALGRSHARKVQTISLKNLDESADATRNLITHYATYILEGGILTADDAPAGLTAEDIVPFQDLKFLSRLYDGLIDVDIPVDESYVARYLYKKANWAYEEIDLSGDGIPDTTYYPLTTLGKVYKDYKELTNVRWEESTSTDFTGSGAYTKETGLMFKTREIFSKNAVTEGWFTNNGLSEVPSDLRARLFRIQVANEVDANYRLEGETAVIEPNKDFGDNGYGRYVNGHYYLTPETYSKTDPHPYLIFDSSSSSWVIVRVDEAIKGPKLSTSADSTSSYDYLRKIGYRSADDLTRNQVAWLVVDLISDSDAYTKAARQEVLDKASIIYHDQKVYDYFETNFPDLFD